MKQYLIVGLVMLAVFLPVRLLFYNYVSQWWLGNLGVMSLIAITMLILIQQNKLGWFGIYFKNRVRRLVFSKLIWVAVLSGLLGITLYGGILYAIDLVLSGENDDTIDLMTSVLVINVTDGSLFNNTATNTQLKDIGLYPSNQSIAKFRAGLADNSTQDALRKLVDDDRIWSTMSILIGVVIHEYNMKSDAWGSHFATVLLVEEIEALGLLLFYRVFYLQKVGVSWQSLGLPKKTKQFVRWYNRPPKKKQEVY